LRGPIVGKCGRELSLHHLALRSLSHLPQHAVCPVAVPTGTGPRTLTARIAVPTGPGLRAPQSAYAVTSPACLPGPTLAQLLASARRPPGRRPYRHGPAEPCDGLRSQALSRPPPGPMLALLLIFHAVCPVAVITGTGLLAQNGSRSQELRLLPEPTSGPTTCHITQSARSPSLPARACKSRRYHSREPRNTCLAPRSARPLVQSTQPAQIAVTTGSGLCSFSMPTQTGCASTGSLPRAVPEPQHGIQPT
jgi:hypothetical protein